MPCYDGSGSSNVSFSDLSSLKAELRKEIEDKMYIVKDELNVRTAQLCEIMLFLQINLPDLYKKLPEELLLWHSGHLLFDENRKKKD